MFGLKAFNLSGGAALALGPGLLCPCLGGFIHVDRFAHIAGGGHVTCLLRSELANFSRRKAGPVLRDRGEAFNSHACPFCNGLSRRCCGEESESSIYILSHLFPKDLAIFVYHAFGWFWRWGKLGPLGGGNVEVEDEVDASPSLDILFVGTVFPPEAGVGVCCDDKDIRIPLIASSAMARNDAGTTIR